MKQILASHNSWTYLPVKHWYQKPIAFTAKCQSVDIQTQYTEYGIRCFDLRVRFDKMGVLQVVHGHVVYDYTPKALYNDLLWLNDHQDCLVRVLLDIRTKKSLTEEQKIDFQTFCAYIEKTYPNIQFFSGRNLYDWKIEYKFREMPSGTTYFEEPSIADLYASVAPPKLIDDWLPCLYARLHNRKNLATPHCEDIVMIDFVNIR